MNLAQVSLVQGTHTSFSYRSESRRGMRERIQMCLVATLVLISSFLFATPLVASWKLMSQFGIIDKNFVPYVNSCFFYNDQHGIVGIDGVNGIFITYDGGASWTPSKIPEGYIGTINDIFMVDSLRGWAVIEDDWSLARGLWRTIDGGLTWTEMPMSAGGMYTSVYETPSALLVTSRFTSPPLSISTNLGATLLPAGIDRYNGVGFVDPLHGVVTGFWMAGLGNQYANGLWTSDGGLTWFTNNLFMECWSVYPKKGTGTFWAIGEDRSDAAVDVEKVFRSDNYGRNFSVVGTMPTRTTGHVAGVGDVLYVQAWTRWQFPSRYVGILRSTDGGVSWKAVGGPSNYRDGRFWVGNCHGRTIIAFDEVGGVWRSDDGGDGLLTDGIRNPFLQPGVVSMSADHCTRDSAICTFFQNSCHSLILQDISFVDSTDEAISSGALTITSMPAIPSSLDFGSQDTIKFLWDPSKLSGPKSKTTFLLHLHSVSDDSTRILDTLISVDVTSLGNTPLFTVSNTKIHYDSLNLCSGLVDTLINVANHGCDTLTLNNATLSGSSEWSLLEPDGSPLLLPKVMPVDSSCSMRVRFRPVNSGTSTAIVDLNLTQLGFSKDTSVGLTGTSYRTVSVLSEQTLRVPATSVCTVYDTLVTVKNNSCDTLLLDSLRSTDPASFELLSGLTPPIHLPPDSVLVVPIRFHPQRNVGSSAQVRYSYHIANDSGAAVTFLAGLGVGGTALLRTSISGGSVHFPDRTECDGGDSLRFALTNGGCDSLQIVTAKLGGPSSGPFSYAISPTLPLGLAGGSGAVNVRVKLDSSGAGNYDAALDIVYTLPDGSLHDTVIEFTATITPAPRIAAMRRVQVDLGTIPFCSSLFDTAYIENHGCMPITVSSITSGGPDYRIVQARGTPFSIPAGSYDSVIVELQPTAVGGNAGSLTIATNDNVAPTKQVSYVATVRPVDKVNFSVQMSNTTLVPGDTAKIDIIPDKDWFDAGLRDINFALTYESDLLSFASVTRSYDPNNSVFTSSVLLPNRQEQLNVRISSNNDIALRKGQPLASFYLLSYLTDSISTPVNVSLMEVNHGDAQYEKCQLGIQSTDAKVTVTFVCGDRILRQFLLTKQVLVGDAPRPDPAHGSSIITFPFAVASAGNVELAVFDGFGRQVRSVQQAVPAGHNESLVLSTESLSSGAYSYTLTYSGNTTASIRGRFVLLQ